MMREGLEWSQVHPEEISFRKEYHEKLSIWTRNLFKLGMLETLWLYLLPVRVCIPRFEHHCPRMLTSKIPPKLFNLVPWSSHTDMTRSSCPCCPTSTHALGFHISAFIFCSRLGLPSSPLMEEANRCPRLHRLNIASWETQAFSWEGLLESRNQFPSSEPA